MKDRYAIFKTNHFSVYTLAENKIENRNNNNENNGNTGININTNTDTNTKVNNTSNSKSPKTGDNISFCWDVNYSYYRYSSYKCIKKEK